MDWKQAPRDEWVSDRPTWVREDGECIIELWKRPVHCTTPVRRDYWSWLVPVGYVEYYMVFEHIEYDGEDEYHNVGVFDTLQEAKDVFATNFEWPPGLADELMQIPGEE